MDDVGMFRVVSFIESGNKHETHVNRKIITLLSIHVNRTLDGETLKELHLTW